jgi:hypothetical protein
MKFLAALAAFFVASWIMVKILMLTVEALLHLLIEALPLFLAMAGACVLVPVVFKFGSWLVRRLAPAPWVAWRTVTRRAPTQSTVFTPGRAAPPGSAAAAPRLVPPPNQVLPRLPRAHHVPPPDLARAAWTTAADTSAANSTLSAKDPAVTRRDPWRPGSVPRLATKAPRPAVRPNAVTQGSSPATAPPSGMTTSPTSAIASAGSAISFLASAGRVPHPTPATPQRAAAASHASHHARVPQPNAVASFRAAVRQPAVHQGPSSRSGSFSSETRGIRRVVLIEGCSGIQVGQDNDQYSVYRVFLSSVALRSSQKLAEELLADGVPWSSDLFRHNGRADIAGLAGGSSTFSSLVEVPDGDTLVIVRNSRGVQVGDHNLQHNDFRIRVSGVKVLPHRLGGTIARDSALEWLRRDPGNQAAVRALADAVARAAQADLVMDLTAQVTRDIGNPAIDGWPSAVHGRTGAQVGGPNRASVKVRVTVSKVDARELEADLLAAQRRMATLRAAEVASAHPDITSPSGPALTPIRGPAIPPPWGGGMSAI